MIKIDIIFANNYSYSMNLKTLFSIIIFSILIISVSNAQNLSTSQEADIEKYKALLSTAKSQNNNNQIYNYLAKIGQIYYNANIPDKSIEYLIEALPLSESLNNKNGTMNLNNYIGTMYQETGNYLDAEKYFQAGLTLALSSKDKENTVNAYLKLALNQQNQSKNDNAISNLKEAEILALELNNTAMLKKIYSRMAECYLSLGNSAEYSRLFTLSSNLLTKEKEEIQAIANAEKANAEKSSLQIKLQNAMMNNMQDSMAVIEVQNEKSKAEIELLENQKKMVELESEKKEAQVKEQEAQLKKNRTLFLSFFIGFGLLIVFILVVLKFLNDKRKANSLLKNMNKELNDKNYYILQKNNEIENQNKELQEKNIKIETQNLELQYKNEEIEAQRDLLESKNQQITESINYASKIQRAILPSERAIFSNFKDALIFYQPRDIVSGDFYWFTKQNDFKFIAAVDCTGHSVPGAFMSMIGNTLLNEIINEKKVFDPALVLTKLHEGVIATLHQQDKDEEATDDGMDITLCRYNDKNKEIIISSANHQIFKYSEQEDEIIEGDIFSIGGHISEDVEFSFTNHTFFADNQTCLYFFSDGYPDQFGGPKGRKFMTDQFHQFITEIHEKPMKEQTELIEEKFKKWKGERRQIDDILIIGIKF